jgi:hypothetical protein
MFTFAQTFPKLGEICLVARMRRGFFWLRKKKTSSALAAGICVSYRL